MRWRKIILPMLALAFCGEAANAQSKAATKTAAAKSKASPVKPAQFTATSTVKSGAVKSASAKASNTKAAPGKYAQTPSLNAAAQRRNRAPARTRPLSTWRAAQMAPTPDRYREIQQALVDKGYFQSTPDGTWGTDSIDALKRFQKDQKLDVDGKLGSLSIMALGLGPRRGTAVAESAPPSEIR